MALTLLAGRVAAQAIPGVAPHEMTKLPEPKGQPIYPEPAKRRHIQGTVLLAITVSEVGVVTDAQLLAGPPELAPAASDRIQQWRFSPYLIDGTPSPVRTTAFVEFRLSGVPEAEDVPDLKLLADLYPLQVECQYLVERKIIEEALGTCRQAAEQSDALPHSQYSPYHITGWDAYAVLLLKQDRAAEAVTAFDKECDYASRLLGMSDKSYGVAYWHRALAHQTLRQNAEAEADFTTAEQSLSVARSSGQDAVVGRNAELALNKVLRQHAALLNGEGRHQDAERLLLKVTP